ncbi:hypothetical protein PR048_033202 [Dryococelus australis]|uniref:RNA-directed DNA polymerase n=1 Tax=Dryococelus australis TaxID=614101 RepID=A0ABQ9G0U9_9NEOP|nr:hypothetical protein PR048_033202 [Dryococelus australis]
MQEMLVHSVKMGRNLQTTEAKRAEFVGAFSDGPGLVSGQGHTTVCTSDQIVLDNGLLFMDDKLIVPANSRPGMLLTLHKGHSGMTKMKSKARQVLYWPRMSQDITVFVTKNALCQAQDNHCGHMRGPVFPSIRLGQIFLILEGSYTCLYDYLPKWIELGSAEEVNITFKGMLATHGIPKLVVTDVPFCSMECLLVQEWGFKIVISSLCYLHSNGMAESGSNS